MDLSTQSNAAAESVRVSVLGLAPPLLRAYGIRTALRLDMAKKSVLRERMESRWESSVPPRAQRTGASRGGHNREARVRREGQSRRLVRGQHRALLQPAKGASRERGSVQTVLKRPKNILKRTKTA